MFCIQRLKVVQRNILPMRKTICIGRPNFITEKQYQKMKLTQAKMQCDDGIPVYLKCGLRDKILYRITVILVICGTILGFVEVCKIPST